MTEVKERPTPGSRSEAVSSVANALGGVAGLALAAISITRKQSIKHAVIANLYEVEAAKIALHRARRDDVEEFARAMIADHEKMGSELRSFIAGTNSPQMPRESLDTVHQTLIDHLNGASDEDFDKTARDDGLKNLAGLALPVLEHHMQMVGNLGQAL